MTEGTHNTGSRESFARVLHHLCTRPKMYTFDGSFRQVVIYIEAYIRGSGFPKGQVNLESGMEPFGRWLADKYGHKQRQIWHQTLLDHCHGDEERALHQLPSLYDEFTAARGEELP